MIVHSFIDFIIPPFLILSTGKRHFFGKRAIFRGGRRGGGGALAFSRRSAYNERVLLGE